MYDISLNTLYLSHSNWHYLYMVKGLHNIKVQMPYVNNALVNLNLDLYMFVCVGGYFVWTANNYFNIICTLETHFADHICCVLFFYSWTFIALYKATIVAFNNREQDISRVFQTIMLSRNVCTIAFTGH